MYVIGSHCDYLAPGAKKPCYTSCPMFGADSFQLEQIISVKKLCITYRLQKSEDNNSAVQC
jgi:hypothetical protein